MISIFNNTLDKSFTYILKKFPVTPLCYIYASIIVLMTFLQQELVLMPEIIRIAVDANPETISVLNHMVNWRWVFLLTPILLFFLDVILTSFCLYVGTFFIFPGKKELTFKSIWQITTISQLVNIINIIITGSIYIKYGNDSVLTYQFNTSIAGLYGESLTEKWMYVPLISINIWVGMFWFLLTTLFSLEHHIAFPKALKFTAESYLAPYAVYVCLIMFIYLYMK